MNDVRAINLRDLENLDRLMIAAEALMERAYSAEAEVVVWRERYAAVRSAAAKAVFEFHMTAGFETPASLRKAMDDLAKEVSDVRRG